MDEIDGEEVRKAQDVFRTHLEAYAYSLLYYDADNSVYYRFLLHPANTDTNEYTLFNVLLTKPFSIQVINEQFDVIGETDIFLGGVYQYFDSFAAKGKLFISNNNPTKPNASEDQISYSIFDLSKR